MQSNAPLTPDDVLRLTSVPSMPGVYVLGSYARNVTFASQQIRAFNLIWALFQLGRLSRDEKVLIVGGGLAGVTAAAAALTQGCKVDLYDALHKELRVQQGNSERYVHPNILKWPGPWKTGDTSFPFLNWSAGMLNDVVVRLQSEWTKVLAHHGDRYRGHFNRLAVKVEQDTNGARLRWREVGSDDQQVSPTYNIVIIAVGVGYDEKPNPAGTRSYWRNNGLHQASLNPPRKVLVSGSGDGALVEALRLRVVDFNHKDFTENLLRRPDFRPFEEKVAQIESRVRADPRFTYALEYDALKFPQSLIDWVTVQLRPDPLVLLNGRDSTPYTDNAAPLNRFVLYILNRCQSMDYLQGDLKEARFCPENKRYEVRISGHQEPYYFDEVVVRHGPERMVENLLPPEVLEPLRKEWDALLDDPTIRKGWWGSFYPSEHGPLESSPRARKLMSLPPLEYEVAVIRILSSAGAEIRWPYGTSSAEVAHGPEGRDAELIHMGRVYIVEIRAYSAPLGREDLERIVKRLNMRWSTTGRWPLIVVSRSGYSAQALEYGKTASIILWDNRDLLSIQDSRGNLDERLDQE